ncbi:LysE family transporter [Actinomadura xylanilytica]|uniref:LysE family transporter n=1 Tax=Actinomadura xylanilytica TaxID=887459 RepID=UPI00255AB183|nr:LysE family transporter [Actinomadura xylanilytica]MDL4774765.1 LysE family transporter [Actinomadura xylanilytica]
MIDSILSGLWAGYGLAVPVGAVAVLMINMTARTSFRNGAAAAIGAATADALYAVVAVVGGSAAASALAPVSTPLRWAAAVILIGMAVRIALQATRTRADVGEETQSNDSDMSPFRAFLIFFGLTALNPWPAIYFVALVLGRQGQESQTPWQACAYVAAIVLASASWQLVLAGGGAVLGRFLTGHHGRFITAICSSLLIAGLAVSVAVTG